VLDSVVLLQESVSKLFNAARAVSLTTFDDDVHLFNRQSINRSR